MRYVMRIAEFNESSNLWTQVAVSRKGHHASLSIMYTKAHPRAGGEWEVDSVQNESSLEVSWTLIFQDVFGRWKKITKKCLVVKTTLCWHDWFLFSTCVWHQLWRLFWAVVKFVKREHCCFLMRTDRTRSLMFFPTKKQTTHNPISSEVRRPAEFKHINKRRKRN